MKGIAGDQRRQVAFSPSPTLSAILLVNSEGEADVTLIPRRPEFLRLQVAHDQAAYVHRLAVRRYAESNRISHLDAFKAFGGVRPLELTQAPRASGAPADVWADRAVGACDVVTFTPKHYSPHPGRTGQFAEHFTFDMFRLRNGRFVEHWDGGTLTAMPVAPAGRGTGE